MLYRSSDPFPCHGDSAESSSTFPEKFVGKRKETAEGPWIL